MDEFDLIARYFTPLSGPEGLGLKDDAALYAPAPGYDLVITADMMSEGVHFPKGEYGADIAQRLLRVNLSDLAAKGASPLGYILTLAWPRHLGPDTLADFAEGLARAQERFGIELWGGDTVRTDGPLTVSATLIGQVPTGQMIRRSGAKPGDDIWVSGHIGDGYLGLLCAQKDPRAEIFGERERERLLSRFYAPEPRLKLGQALAGYKKERLASASVDISDGLLADLGHIASASACALYIDLDAVPLSSEGTRWIGAQSDPQAAKLALITGGDDYEIGFTVNTRVQASLTETDLMGAGQNLDLKLTKIGRAKDGQGTVLRGRGGKAIDFGQGGYCHFTS